MCLLAQQAILLVLRDTGPQEADATFLQFSQIGADGALGAKKVFVNMF